MPDFIDLTPDPRILDMLGKIELKGWQCIAELIDNSLDSIISRKGLKKDNIVDIKIPLPSRLQAGDPIIIRDNAKGMDKKQLQNALSAGYSGQAQYQNLGLFGMGFNIATARLGTKVTVWTSKVTDDKDIGVTIDLREMRNEQSFRRELLVRPEVSKTSPKDKSGTTIEISNYRTDIHKLINGTEVIRKLKNAYSNVLFDKHNVSISVNGTEIKGKKFCVWDHLKDRSVVYMNEEIAPYQEFDRTLYSIPFCTSCFSELKPISNDELPKSCDYCQAKKGIVKKEYKVSGWLGIQRFFDIENYGVDIIRNGRIIVPKSKDLFTWKPREGQLDEDKKAMLPDGESLFDYPRDGTRPLGRIVGEIHANFIIPEYTKDAFPITSDWLDALEVVRGNSPLQPEWATKRLQLSKNQSPLAKLFYGFRKVEPGRKHLVCGLGVGGFNAGNEEAKRYYDKWVDGGPDFQEDDKWFDLVLRAEVVDPTDPEPALPPVGPDDPSEPTDPPIEEEFPGAKSPVGEYVFDLTDLISKPRTEVKLYRWWPQSRGGQLELGFNPVVFKTVSSNNYHVYLNQSHNMLRDFQEGARDLLVMEIAHRYAGMVDDPSMWTVTRLYYELKQRVFPSDLISANNLVLTANNLANDLIDYFVTQDLELQPKPQLNETQIETLKQSYARQENKQADKTSFITGKSSFLKYMGKDYIFIFVENYPSLVFDDNFFKLTYEGYEDIRMRQRFLDDYMGALRDVRWIINDLVDKTPDEIQNEKIKVIRAKLSLAYLDEYRV
jgi:hypothetical protein